MKPLIIYHDNCADGFGAAWAAYRKFGEDGAEYLPMNYNDRRVSVTHDELAFPVDVAGRDIYILGFSFPHEVMCALFDACREACTTMFVRDHHKTHFEQMGLNPGEFRIGIDGRNYDLVLDPDRSGCVLAWELFHPGTHVPRMLQLIQDRELWAWRMDGTRDFATALRSTPMTFKAFDHACENVHILTNDGAAMNKLFDQQLAGIVKRPVSVVLRGPANATESVVGLSTNCTPQFASEAGDALAEMCGTFGMTWMAGEAGAIYVSLRSKFGFDVSAIAQRYGGGGHRNAAGFRMTPAQFMAEVIGRV